MPIPLALSGTTAALDAPVPTTVVPSNSSEPGIEDRGRDNLSPQPSCSPLGSEGNQRVWPGRLSRYSIAAVRGSFVFGRRRCRDFRTSGEGRPDKGESSVEMEMLEKDLVLAVGDLNC